jgi:hypothetical protein
MYEKGLAVQKIKFITEVFMYKQQQVHLFTKYTDKGYKELY